MKTYFLMALTICLQAAPAMSETEWNNPAVLCPEEILPSGIKCLDFSSVKMIYTDFPDSTTTEEIKDWKNNKSADLKLCRNLEVLRREKVKPGTFTAGEIENAWMVVDGGKQVQVKLDAIDAATKKYGIPPQVLIGALKQESILSSIGVSPDGGNYSCGIAQLNIQEWCQSMNRLSSEERLVLGWPENMSCESDSLPTSSVKPYYEIAIKNAGSKPSYQLTSEDFKNIKYKDVSSRFFKSDEGIKKHNAIMSFVMNCQDISLSINFKARTLKSLFANFVPANLRNAEQYAEGETFSRSCKTPYAAKAYPLHTGWLLAVAMYNAGPQQAKLLEHYYQVKNNNFPEINPLGLIEGLHWGGKAKSSTSDYLVFKDQYGTEMTQKWFKSCIVQRHVARVIQHVTEPAVSIAKSLDQSGCKLTGIPEYRQASSGIKED